MPFAPGSRVGSYRIVSSLGESETGEVYRAIDERSETPVAMTVLAERLTNGQIALRLGVSERTVESHVSALLRKLAVRGRGELAEKASASSA